MNTINCARANVLKPVNAHARRLGWLVAEAGLGVLALGPEALEHGLDRPSDERLPARQRTVGEYDAARALNLVDPPLEAV